MLAFAGTGFCGALSTYSTFGYETLRLAEDGARSYAVLNAAASIAAGARRRLRRNDDRPVDRGLKRLVRPRLAAGGTWLRAREWAARSLSPSRRSVNR
ncbi:fluoride efflux transporter FluC [Actinomadura madurae]|uniref:fluoride efflux transporter FluC n=1 Tax=Actinomadura madurae TaxID=1993 RepID=UPI0035590DE1